MHPHRAREATASQHPHRSLRTPHCSKDSSQKGILSGFLLADGGRRRRSNRAHLRRVPVLRSADPHDGSSIPNHPHHVAVRGLGVGHGRPPEQGARGFTHLLVTVDKFTKWIEARLIVSIKSAQAAAFFQDIVHRFGVPNSIITDNGSNFTGKHFLEFCDDHNICVDWQQSHTRAQMAMLNGQTAWSCRDSNQGSIIGSKNSLDAGSRSSWSSYGAQGQPRAGQPDSHHSLWSTARKPTCPPTWNMVLRG